MITHLFLQCSPCSLALNFLNKIEVYKDCTFTRVYFQMITQIQVNGCLSTNKRTGDFFLNFNIDCKNLIWNEFSLAIYRLINKTNRYWLSEHNWYTTYNETDCHLLMWQVTVTDKFEIFAQSDCCLRVVGSPFNFRESTDWNRLATCDLIISRLILETLLFEDGFLPISKWFAIWFQKTPLFKGGLPLVSKQIVVWFQKFISTQSVSLFKSGSMPLDSTNISNIIG